MIRLSLVTLFFFFNDTATTEIYTLSLHDALPIFPPRGRGEAHRNGDTSSGDRLSSVFSRELYQSIPCAARGHELRDRKSTRLNSSHSQISYAVFCLKKKNTIKDYVLSHTSSMQDL